MRRLGRLSGLGVLFFIGCGGGQTEPKSPPPPAPSALVKEPPPEKADLSPVAAPPELFVVGRLKRAGPIADTLGKWAGLPMDIRKALDHELHGFEAAVAWDAPIELAVALPANGKRRVRTVVSVGLSSLGVMMNAVRERGLSPERLFPEVFAFAAPNGIHCAVGPALGNASARLVCGERSTEVEALFPYMTRGLPNENLGNRDLEVELRAEPIKRRFSSEISGARLFAGFLLRQLEVDSPRLDRALGDATYAVADELVLEVEDTDSIKLGGNLDDANRNVSLELAWKFRSQRSWLASSSAELARRQAPPPPSLARLPADASSAGYAVDLTTSKSPAIKSAVLEVLDAYLEREKIGKQARERVQHLASVFWSSTQVSYVFAKGNLPADTKASETAKRLGWRVTRGEFSA
ncbi:MAG TPA: hypothetical protein VF103_08825, partial [Polyangiaceae bacterium]